MATIDSLANETLYDIMEMLKTPSLPLWDTGLQFPPGSYDALRAAALVCSRWRDPAQRALFDTLLVDTSKVLRTQKFVTSPATPRAHTLCWELLAHPCLAGLKRLTLLCPEDFDDPPGPAPILAMPLESLSLWIFDTDDNVTSLAFIAALFTASSASLQTLHLKIYDQLSEASIVPSFHLIAANLRTLILESAHNVLEGHLDLLSACTSLEHLALKSDDYDYETHTRNFKPTGPLYTQAILDALPPTPTLRHLSLDLDERLDLVFIATLLKNHVLQHLKRLDLPRMAVRGGEDASLEPRSAVELEDAVAQALLSMKETCEDRGIVCKSMGEYSLWNCSI
ncbi:hypothetical protein RQP46_009569 [Phenoliferia psychrophenolica]